MNKKLFTQLPLILALISQQKADSGFFEDPVAVVTAVSSNNTLNRLKADPEFMGSLNYLRGTLLGSHLLTGKDLIMNGSQITDSAGALRSASHYSDLSRSIKDIINIIYDETSKGHSQLFDNEHPMLSTNVERMLVRIWTLK